MNDEETPPSLDFLAGMEEAARLCEESTWGADESKNEYERGWSAASRHMAIIIRNAKTDLAVCLCGAFTEAPHPKCPVHPS